MERWNSEAIPRDQLRWALSNAEVIRKARRVGRCLLCRRDEVNEAALCQVCWALLSDEELAAASRWLIGVAP